MLNWFKDKYGNLKAWIIRNGKRILVTLVSIATLTAGAMAVLPNDEVPYVDVNGEIIAFPYTDDNSGENLIIRTDKEEYHVAGYNEIATAYVAVGNNSGETDTIDLVSAMPEDVNIKSISKLEKDVVYEYDVPVYEERCETIEATKTATTTKESTQEVCNNVLIRTDTATSTRDEWISLEKTNFALKRIVLNKKYIPEQLVKKQVSGFTLKDDEIGVFKIDFTTSQNKGSKEFFFEAIGSKAYGHLDPTVTVGDWACYYSVTATSTISGTHTDFPILIDPSDAPTNIGDCDFKADATDIRISTTSPAGGGSIPILDHEVVSSTEVWARVPSLSASNALYVLMDNPSATDISTSSTWNSNYKAVYHMQDSSGGVVDSTSNSNDSGSPNNSPVYSQTGQISDSIQFDSNSEYFPLSSNYDTFGASDFSISMWIKSSSSGRLFSHDEDGGGSDSNGNWGFQLQSDSTPNSLRLFYRGATSVILDGSTQANDNSWHFACGVRDSTNGARYLYLDGSQDGSISSGDTFTANGDSGSTIGGESDSSSGHPNSCVGYYDEIKLYSGVLSSDWIATEYKNQNSPTNFWTTGTATSTSAGAVRRIINVQ